MSNRNALLVGGSMAAVLVAGILGYLLGAAGAPDASEAATARGAARQVAYRRAVPAARAEARAAAYERAVSTGRERGREVGLRVGRADGEADAAIEVEEIAGEEAEAIEEQSLEDLARGLLPGL